MKSTRILARRGPMGSTVDANVDEIDDDEADDGDRRWSSSVVGVNAVVSNCCVGHVGVSGVTYVCVWRARGGDRNRAVCSKYCSNDNFHVLYVSNNEE